VGELRDIYIATTAAAAATIQEAAKNLQLKTYVLGIN
jgi:hypothetical protein